MKIIRELRFEDIRRICIEHNLYTNGTNEEYSELKNFVDGIKNMTDLRLMLVAKDIMNHSTTDYSISTILTLLNEKAFLYVEE